MTEFTEQPHYVAGNYLDVVNQLCYKEKKFSHLNKPDKNAVAIRSKMKEIFIKSYPDSPELADFLLGIVIKIIRKVFDWGSIPRGDIFNFPLSLADELAKKYPITVYQKLLQFQNTIVDRTITLSPMCIIKITDKCKIQREIRRYLRENIKQRIVHVEGSPILFCVFHGKDMFHRIEYIEYKTYSKIEFDGKTFHQINTRNIERAMKAK